MERGNVSRECGGAGGEGDARTAKVAIATEAAASGAVEDVEEGVPALLKTGEAVAACIRG